MTSAQFFTPYLFQWSVCLVQLPICLTQLLRGNALLTGQRNNTMDGLFKSGTQKCVIHLNNSTRSTRTDSMSKLELAQRFRSLAEGLVPGSHAESSAGCSCEGLRSRSKQPKKSGHKGSQLRGARDGKTVRAAFCTGGKFPASRDTFRRGSLKSGPTASTLCPTSAIYWYYSICLVCGYIWAQGNMRCWEQMQSSMHSAGLPAMTGALSSSLKGFFVRLSSQVYIARRSSGSSRFRSAACKTQHFICSVAIASTSLPGMLAPTTRVPLLHSEDYMLKCQI